ncbi:o-succinylbenzoate--CoA ligase [Mammaliicoccus vitulinus]|uniref:o-succinylbenzoate--CoA ligase n=1 Tax=Mammaliicoccus vitulinus TaxID=71237 RepID=UPI002B257E28|nr:o-succinylbenzoate--CoA ligase [Mammaliicoccus vitulinus]WQK88816.1 o-succinylbenzoate--CoA ligase [Mammaliicoccus vitulinus]
MKHWIEERNIESPNKIAIKQGDVELTYRQLFNRAKVYASYLNQLNLKRVAFYIKNDVHHVSLIVGAWLANVEIVMVNTKLTSREIEQQLESIGVETVLTYKSLNIKQNHIIINDITSINNKNLDFHLNMDDIATIMFTSGTTGPAKAVPQTFSNHYYSAIGCKESLGYHGLTKWLSVLPIYHISGLSVLIRSLIEGFTVVLEPKFDVDRVMYLIKHEGITHISLVPQTLQWLINDELTQPYQLEKILLGGAKLSEAIINKSLEYQLPIYNSFGMTETCSQFVTASPEMLRIEPRTVGKIPSNVKLKIMNKNAEGHGEVSVLGKNVMNGYLTNGSNADTFEDGYFKTGDIGSIDDNGYVYIYDRRKDLIISGGENIYPYEIEHIILNHPEVTNCVVVPVEDDKWGQVPALVYESHKNIDSSEFKCLLDDYLAKYKHPKYFYKMKEIPRTSTGKLSRYKVKEWITHA